MKLKKLKLFNYRCFGPEELIIELDDLTSFIGNNSAGKSAALSALNCIFSENSVDRILKKSDFHFSECNEPNAQTLYIETVFEFDDLEDQGNNSDTAIPLFFKSMVVSDSTSLPYLRIRLEATWEQTSSAEGSIESRIYYITAPESEANITDDKKKLASRKEIEQIRFIYIPAVRDPSKHIKNVSGSMLHRLMKCINWQKLTVNSIKSKLTELNNILLSEEAVSEISESVKENWNIYGSDDRYSNAHLCFNNNDIDSVVNNTEVIFQDGTGENQFKIDELGDGLRSLFYISLVSSILDLEIKLNKERLKQSESSLNLVPPFLSIIAIEEPENHIAPHLIGKLIANILCIAKKCNAQILLTSHSTSIIRRIEPDRLRYFRIEHKKNDCGAIDYSTSVRRITLPDEESESEQYKYIKEAVKAYPELYFAKLVILGEGDSEEILLPRFLSAKSTNIDEGGISIVPLGGRHVNHFWRLLNDLKIPHITLLDLDLGRYGGGFGRIKYVLKQLIHISALKYEDIILKNDNCHMTLEQLDSMDSWKNFDLECIKSWTDFLEKYHVYFSAPLDIDFMMLESYEQTYMSILSMKEGPRYAKNESDTKKSYLVSEADKHNDKTSIEYQQRISDGIKSTLKNKGGDGDCYTEKQKELMIWYSYFFLQRGKPSTHIEMISRISDDELLNGMPDVIKRLIDDANNQIRSCK